MSKCMDSIKNRMKAMGQRIKEGRRAILISQEEFAKKARSSLNYICEIENGESVPSFWALSRISRALKIHPEELLTGCKVSPCKFELGAKEKAKIKRIIQQSTKNIEELLCSIK